MTPLQNKKLTAYVAVFVAAATVLQVTETLLPHPIPWVRLGLANAGTLTALILYGKRAALSVTCGRVLLGSLLTGSFLSPVFYLSCAGGIVSTLTMMVLYRPLGLLSPVGISILGGVSHNAAQLVMAYFLMVGHPGVFSLSGRYQ